MTKKKSSKQRQTIIKDLGKGEIKNQMLKVKRYAQQLGLF